MAYLRGLARRREISSELEDEMRFHLEQQIDMNVRRGMSNGRVAGGVDQAQISGEPAFRVDIRPNLQASSCHMSTRKQSDRKDDGRIALLQGTLDLLILRTLICGPQHGQGVARAIQAQSEHTLIVDHGSLYPALQRLEARGWIQAEWGTSDNNRKARFYELTKAGRKQLVGQTQQWRRITAAIGRILGPAEG